MQSHTVFEELSFGITCMPHHLIIYTHSHMHNAAAQSANSLSSNDDSDDAVSSLSAAWQTCCISKTLLLFLNVLLTAQAHDVQTDGRQLKVDDEIPIGCHGIQLGVNL
jgi:hypothetical protein